MGVACSRDTPMNTGKQAREAVSAGPMWSSRQGQSWAVA